MFENRRQAGQALADVLRPLACRDLVIFALPRGGLPVAAEIAKQIRAPLDLILVRKLSAPQQPELAIGAVVDGASPALILHDEIIKRLRINESFIADAKYEAITEIERRRDIYLKHRPPVSPKDKIVIIVDDGLATGATMEAAIKASRQSGAKKVIVAVPVAPSDTLDRLENLADQIICLETPSPFWSVGSYYNSFPQVSDGEVIDCLSECEYDPTQNKDQNASLCKRD